MRNLSIAMILIGALFTGVAIVFAFGDTPLAATVAILIPSVSLIAAGGILFGRYRK